MSEIDPKIQFLYDAIMRLSIQEQRALLQLLQDDDDSSAGVREPRRPRPKSPGDIIAIEIPEEDEWIAPKEWI